MSAAAVSVHQDVPTQRSRRRLPAGAIRYPSTLLCAGHGEQVHRTADAATLVCGFGCRLPLRHSETDRLDAGAYRSCPSRAPIYLTGASNSLTLAAAAWQPKLGVLAQPGNNLHQHGPSYNRWAIDNGVYGVAMQHYLGRRGPWNDDDTSRYLRYLKRVCDEVDTSRVLFATAPDVLSFIDNPDPTLAAQKKHPIPIGDAEATWARSREVFDQIRSLGLKAALVAQDGFGISSPGPTQWGSFDVLFLGGSDEFKLGSQADQAANSAWRFGKWVHMGRVNSLKRMRRAREIGCDSADGTYVMFGARTNVPKVLSWLDHSSAPLACPVHYAGCDCPPRYPHTQPPVLTPAAQPQRRRAA